MRIFNIGGGSGDDNYLPPELEDLLNKITDVINETIDKEYAETHGLDDRSEKLSAEHKADHDRVDALAAYLKDKQATPEGLTDGYRLRIIALQLFMDKGFGPGCVHGNKPAEDMLKMADRLDELDLKESEIGA